MQINTIQMLMLGLMGLIVVIGVLLFVIDTKKQTKISTHTLIMQISFVLVIISGFNVAAACSKAVSATPNIYIYLLWFVTIGFIVLLLYIKKGEKPDKVYIKKVILNHKWLIIVLAFSGVLRYFLMYDITIQRWDAGQYYYALGTACENYQFTINSFWDNFRLCNHSTLGFSLIMGLGEFLNPRGVQGVLFVNLILTIVGLYCIYVLLRNYFARLDDKQAAMGVLLISVAPLFLGTFAYFNVDYLLAMAFVFMIYCEYKKQYLLLFFWGAILVQTKETGVFVFAGYYIGHFVYWLTNKKGTLIKKIINILEENITRATIGVAFCYAIYVYKLGAFTAWKYAGEDGSSVLWSNSGMNCFGFQPRNIYLKCIQFFVLNFSWILLVILLILFLISVIRNKMRKIYLNNMQGLIGAIVSFMLFGFFYITWDMVRYNILFVMLSIILFVVIYEQLCLHLRIFKAKILVYWSICFLFVVQTFIPIDIISNKAFNLLNTGTRKMLCTGKMLDYLGDSLVNNYQYTWIDNAFDIVFEEIDYNEQMTILVGEKQAPGSHIDGNYRVYPVFWDKTIKRRVMYENDATCSINVVKGIDNTKEIPDTVIVIFIPYYEEDEEELLSKYRHMYQISERHIVKNWGGAMSYYYMRKR